MIETVLRRRLRAAARSLPALLAASLLSTAASANPIEVLFVGNSFTHGKYDPVRNYNAGFGTGTDVVHDLRCPTAATCSADQQGTQIDPRLNPPPGSLSDQLNFLKANPGSQYNEPGPRGGVAGMFLQFTKEAGLSYEVSLIAVSSATLNGYLTNSASTAGSLPLIESAKWDKVVLQDQSFQPLPNPIFVNGVATPTRGNPANFVKGVNGLVNGIDAADNTAGRPNAAVTLLETPPLAAYGFTSSNPAAPIFGSSTGPAGSQFAPYVGDADPMAAMAGDLHNAYVGEAAAYDAANPTKSHVDVALAGDAWVSTIHLGLALADPYLPGSPGGKIDLWDSDPLDACCTTPIGYHPSVYGDYLDALVAFEQITGVNPLLLSAEFDPSNPNSAAAALGVAPDIAFALAGIAAETVALGGPVPAPEPSSLALLAAGVAGLALRRRRR